MKLYISIKELDKDGRITEIAKMLSGNPPSAAAVENAKELLPDSIIYCGNAYEAAEGADCLVIATEWNQFRSLDTNRVKELMASPVMVDLRNVYKPERMREAGFTYDSVGRSATNLPKR